MPLFMFDYWEEALVELLNPEPNLLLNPPTNIKNLDLFETCVFALIEMPRL